jgi:hypothetical protein
MLTTTTTIELNTTSTTTPTPSPLPSTTHQDITGHDWLTEAAVLNATKEEQALQASKAGHITSGSM